MKYSLIFIFALLTTNAFAKEVKVIQKDKKFDKASVDVQVGDTLVFENKEKDITHNVYSLGPKNAFELKTQAPGSSSPVTFKEEGATDVECAIHPGMKLKVNVKK